MADQNDPIDNGQDDADENVQQDPIKNVKAEFQRKIGNTESAIEQLKRQNEELMAMIQQSLPKSAPTQSDKSLKDLIYDDPDKVAEILESRVTQKADRIVEQRLQRTQEINTAVASMVAKYPEFNDPSSDAYKLAIERSNRLPKNLQGTAEGVRLTMLDVADELGLVTANKRKQSTGNDDFSLGGGNSSGSSSRRSSKSGAKENEPSDDQLTLAKLLYGTAELPDKVVDGIRKHNGRKTWNKYR